jgi:hypothetical protein
MSRRTEADSIPQILHFVWIDAGVPLGPLQRLCLRTALTNTTCRIVVHTDNPALVPRYPGLEIRPRPFPDAVNGHPVDRTERLQIGQAQSGLRVAHLSDLVRLEILHEEGGIYSDADVLWLRNPWEYWGERVVVGFGNQSYRILVNSVLMSRPREPALLVYHRWLTEQWPCRKYWLPANPYKLWQQDPSVTMVPRHVFAPVSWRGGKHAELTAARLERSVACHLYAAARPEPPRGPALAQLARSCRSQLQGQASPRRQESRRGSERPRPEEDSKLA